MSSYLLTCPAEEGLSTLHHTDIQLDKTWQQAWIKRHCYFIDYSAFVLHIVMLINTRFVQIIVTQRLQRMYGTRGLDLHLSAKIGSYKIKSPASFNQNIKSVNPNIFRQNSKIHMM